MRIGLDFDGVICATPFGRLAVHAPGEVPPLPEGYERLYDRPVSSNPLRYAIEYLRFAWRPPAEDAKAVLAELASEHELYVVTGRSVAGLDLVRRWLKRTGIGRSITDVRMAPPGLRPAQHKLAIAKMLGIDAHVDDDPRTAYHLARNGVARVYLLDHAGAHDEEDPVPAGLVCVRSLREFAGHAGS
jgi:uncharacterized HAD superfamily protein